MAVELDCAGKTVREINTAIKGLIAGGEDAVTVRNPGARHNLGVALLQPSTVTFDGSVGYFCGGLMDGATVESTEAPAGVWQSRCSPAPSSSAAVPVTGRQPPFAAAPWSFMNTQPLGPEWL